MNNRGIGLIEFLILIAFAAIVFKAVISVI